MKNKLLTRDFSLVVIGQIISILGSAILRFAINLYVLDLTGRADVFALVIALSSIPGIISSPIGGAIADRFNRRNLMVIFDFLSSAVVLLLLALLSVGLASIAVIGVILAALSVIGSMYQPAVQASVPVLVSDEHLASANGIVSGVGALSSLLGPVIGGILYGLIGIKILIAASCAAFFISAVMEIFIRIPFTGQKLERHIIPTITADMKAGALYIIKNKPLIFKVIIIAAALNMFLSPFLIIGVPYILRITLNSSEAMYGIGMGIVQFSAMIGAILAGSVSNKLSMPKLHRVLFIAAILILPTAFAVSPMMLRLGYWPTFSVFFTFYAIIVLLLTVTTIYVITFIQIETPNIMLGKVMAIINAVLLCATPLGQAMYGILFEKFSHAVYIPILLAFCLTTALAFVARLMLKGDSVSQAHTQN